MRDTGRRGRKRRRAGVAHPPAAPTPGPEAIAALDRRGLPIVSQIAEVARSAAPPAAKLEGALALLFASYGDGHPEFADLVLTSWLRARQDQQCRLTLAWQREQLRLSVEEILSEGLAQGVFRPGFEPGAVAAVMLGAAEGRLLQTAAEGGAVSSVELIRALLRLTLTEA